MIFTFLLAWEGHRKCRLSDCLSPLMNEFREGASIALWLFRAGSEDERSISGLQTPPPPFSHSLSFLPQRTEECVLQPPPPDYLRRLLPDIGSVLTRVVVGVNLPCTRCLRPTSTYAGGTRVVEPNVPNYRRMHDYGTFSRGCRRVCEGCMYAATRVRCVFVRSVSVCALFFPSPPGGE